MNQPTERSATALPAPRILDGEIVQASTPAGPVVQLSPDQFRSLLARVDRPVIIQGPERAPATYTRPAGGSGGHPGIDVTIPAAAHGGYVLPANVGPLAPVPETRTIAPLAFIASAAAFLGGPLAELLGNSLPTAIVLCCVGFAGGVWSLSLLLRSEP